MTLSEYLNIRDTGMKLTQRILQRCTNDRMIVKAAEEIGIMKNGKILFDIDMENDVVCDYLAFDFRSKKNIMELFIDSEPSLTENELDILEAMLDAKFSLFEIVSVNQNFYSVQLYDILRDKRMNLIDKGFSRSATPDLLLATRLIRISENECMTSGVSYLFWQSMRAKLLSGLDVAKRKNGELTDRMVFVFFWKMNKPCGINARSEYANE
jgi:hypothetical protein